MATSKADDSKDPKAGVKPADDTTAKAPAAEPKKAAKAPEVPEVYKPPVDADGDGIADDALKGSVDEPRKDADGTVANPPDTAPSPTPHIPGGVFGGNGPI
jgi:hypothetical protein